MNECPDSPPDDMLSDNTMQTHFCWPCGLSDATVGVTHWCCMWHDEHDGRQWCNRGQAECNDCNQEQCDQLGFTFTSQSCATVVAERENWCDSGREAFDLGQRCCMGGLSTCSQDVFENMCAYEGDFLQEPATYFYDQLYSIGCWAEGSHTEHQVEHAEECYNYAGQPLHEWYRCGDWEDPRIHQHCVVE